MKPKRMDDFLPLAGMKKVELEQFQKTTYRDKLYILEGHRHRIYYLSEELKVSARSRSEI